MIKEIKQIKNSQINIEALTIIARRHVMKMKRKNTAFAELYNRKEASKDMIEILVCYLLNTKHLSSNLMQYTNTSLVNIFETILVKHFKGSVK